MEMKHAQGNENDYTWILEYETIEKGKKKKNKRKNTFA